MHRSSYASQRRLLFSACIAALTAGCAASALNGPASELSTSQAPRKMLKLSEADREHPIWKSLEQLRKGDLTAANNILNAALNLNPRQANLHFLNGYIYELRGKREGLDVSELAPAGYLGAFNNDRHHWAAAYRLGIWHLEKRNYKLARQWLGEAAMIKDDSSEIFTALADACYMSFDPVAAEAFLDRAAKLTGDTPENLRNRALVNAALNDVDDANSYIEEYKIFAAPAETHRLSNRVRQWRSFHDTYKGGIQKAQFFGGNSPTSVPSSNSAGTTKQTTKSEEDTEELKKLPGVLVIDAVIIRQKTSIQETRGVNLLKNLQVTFSGDVFKLVRSAATGGTDSTTLSNNFTINLGEGTSGSITYSLNIANNTDQRTEVLARPSITVVDAETGSFFLGEEVTYAVTGDNADSFDKEVGISFEVTPELLDNGKVRLEAKAEFDTFTTKASGVGFSEVIPTLKNKITSTAIMEIGQTLVLGGGTQEEKSKTSDATPVLSRIPVLQYFFSESTSVQADTSLIFLITPRLAESLDDKSEVDGAAGEQGAKTDSAMMDQLRHRFRNWFNPTSNMTKALVGLSYSDLYREFREGDLRFSDSDQDGDFDRLLDNDGEGFLNTYENGFWPELLRYFYFE